MNNNNSLDNVNSLNNNIEISYNKQNIVFYYISQLACFIRIIQMFLSF